MGLQFVDFFCVSVAIARWEQHASSPIASWAPIRAPKLGPQAEFSTAATHGYHFPVAFPRVPKGTGPRRTQTLPQPHRRRPRKASAGRHVAIPARHLALIGRRPAALGTTCSSSTRILVSRLINQGIHVGFHNALANANMTSVINLVYLALNLESTLQCSISTSPSLQCRCQCQATFKHTFRPSC